MKEFFLFSLIIGICSCKSSPKKDTYDYFPLSKFKNDSLQIKNGTSVKILALSGGQESDKENVYYYQVLVINQETGDTLNIIAPLFKIPGSEVKDGKVYIPPMEFNPDKNIFFATYERKNDTSLNFLLQVMGDNPENEGSEDVSKYKQQIKPELVAINNSLPIFKNNYKTVIGILSFDNDPR